MSDARTTFIEQVEAELGRITCAMVLDAGEDLPRIRRELEALAVKLADAPFTGLVSLERTLSRAAREVTSSHEAGAVVAAVESALGRWKVGGDATVVLEPDAPSARVDPQPAPAPSASAAAPAAAAPTPVADEDELEVLRSDPEIATMFIAEALDHL